MDGALFGPLLEKLWAKINGSYEKTTAGWSHEALRVLSGAPAYDYLTSSYTSDEIWKLITDAARNNFIVGCGTSGTGSDRKKSELGLSQSHAYALLGTYELRD